MDENIYSKLKNEFLDLIDECQKIINAGEQGFKDYKDNLDLDFVYKKRGAINLDEERGFLMTVIPY